MTSLHATCVLLDGAAAAFGAPSDAGILLTGESGSGKSELALRLIERGAKLVSDDRTRLRLENGCLRAEPVGELAGLLEVRHVGILQLPYAESARIGLVILLSKENLLSRMPVREWYDPPHFAIPRESRPPMLRLWTQDASAPAKAAAAVAAHANALFRERSNPT